MQTRNSYVVLNFEFVGVFEIPEKYVLSQFCVIYIVLEYLVTQCIPYLNNISHKMATFITTYVRTSNPT